MRFAPFISGLALCAALAPFGAAAAPNYSRIELLGAAAGLGNGGPLLLGVRIEPRPGWKTYWRAPGESGLPPVFTFRVHDNADQPQILWPAPKRLMLQGLESYGYDGPVIFPFYVRPQDASKQIQLEVQVDYAVCLDICVPEQAVLHLILPPGAAHATPDREALQAALARVPHQQHEKSPYRIQTAYVQQNGAQAILVVQAEARQGFSAPDMFADGPADLLFAAPQISYLSNRRQADFRLAVTQLDPAQPLIGQTVTLTLADGEIAVEKQVKLAEQVRTE